jgi:hypothetical protein
VAGSIMGPCWAQPLIRIPVNAKNGAGVAGVRWFCRLLSLTMGKKSFLIALWIVASVPVFCRSMSHTVSLPESGGEPA